MPSAAPWYESSTVLSGVGVVVSILALLVTVWGVLYAVRPRQALYYRLKSFRPVGDFDPESQHAALHGLKDPKVLTISLRGRGRKDVSSAAFDSGEPIAITAGGPIVALLGTPESYPPERSMPKVQVAEGALKISPGLIGRSQLLTYTVLADVAKPNVRVQGSLIDVTIGRRDTRFGGLFTTFWAACVVTVAFAVNNGVFWHIHTQPFNYVRISGVTRWVAYIVDVLAILYLIRQFADDVWNFFQ
jgi:hypothetical protein